MKCCRNEDAERDCTTVLSLNPGNVKALFRRAQARVGLGKYVDAQRGELIDDISFTVSSDGS